MSAKEFQVKPFSPALGAEITGINLANGLNSKTYHEIRKAFLKFQVLFFKDQTEIAAETQIKIGKLFGELHAHPAAPQMTGHPEIFEIHTQKNSKVANGEFWHSDVSCDEIPPLGTMLQIHILPESGGDTLFSNTYTAYDALSDSFKKTLSNLTALHESEHIYRGRYSDRGMEDEGKIYPQAIHPVVRTHPETGKKAIYVNRTFTTRINELTETESRAVLNYLFDHCEKIDFQIRFRWQKNDVAFWDNRCAMHRAVWDYWPEERKGRRVTIKGDRPT
ncbi:MAG: taurine dioxygenase [Rhodospirillaceae bacterium]|nr:taurine dioxygenase [Rhodospirillaceae bacterium]|tara:strand:- start:2751 stop:3581 length:831 start_codon:yes stop_codon:yes gene_type:complete